METLTLEGWEGGAPVRAVLTSPDRAQAQAAERVGMKLRGLDEPLLLQQLPAALAAPAASGSGASSGPGVGACVWDGGLALVDWLAGVDPAAYAGGTTAVELGCGPGAAGLAAARLGVGGVALTDRLAALRLAASNVARNWLAPGRPKPGRAPGACGCAVVLPLEWGGPAWAEQAAAAVVGAGGAAGLEACAGVDLVLASDVAYPAPPGEGASPDPAAFAAAAAAVAGPDALLVFTFEARGGEGVAAPLRVGLLAAVAAAFGAAPVRVGGGGDSGGQGDATPWRPAHVEVYECVRGNGGPVGRRRGGSGA